ncbi:MAG: DNA cytosine methyltransferase [Pseudomonadota bacterium]
MNHLSLFSGAGGEAIASTHIHNWRTVGYVEWNDHCQRVIRQRIDDELLPNAPIYGDINTFITDGYAAAYTGVVDILTAGFPCQPFSVTGNRQGYDDSRNAWPQTADVIRIVRPKQVYLENVAGLLTHQYIRTIFADLAEMGMDAKWGSLGGFAANSPCNGERLWIVAVPAGSFRLQSMVGTEYQIIGEQENTQEIFEVSIANAIQQDDYARIERSSNELATGMERLKTIGNGQDPLVAATAYQLLTEGF